jgi:hypothetical protein
MNRPSKVALLALAVASLCATAARAETIYLKCPPEMAEPYVVDLTNNTVNGVQAVVTPISIDWDMNNNVADIHHHIDRAAGTETMTGIVHLGGDRPAPTFTSPCVSVSAPAAKF